MSLFIYNFIISCKFNNLFTTTFKKSAELNKIIRELKIFNIGPTAN